MQAIRAEHKQDTIDYIEANIGCKVSDAFAIHDKMPVLEQYEKYLQERGVPCEFIFYNKDKYELFIPKSEKEKAIGLLTQFRKQNPERDDRSNTQQKSAPSKKPKR